jgi:hypothetical protein
MSGDEQVHEPTNDRAAGLAANGGVSPLRLVVAAAAGAAAAIHFGMVPSHGAESTVEAVGFGVAGWLGVLFALGVVLRPSGRLLLAGAVTHLAFIAVWAVSRIAGLPFGAHSGHAEKATSIDLFATVLEGVVVLGAVLATRQREATRPAGQLAHTAAGFVAAVAMVGATMALVSPSARDHAQAGHGNHDESTSVAAQSLTAAPAADSTHAHSDDESASAGEVTSEAAAGQSDAAQLSASPTPVADADADAADSADAHDHGSAAAVAAPSIDLSTRCDLGLNSVSFWEESTIVHGGEGQPYAGSAELDELIRTTTKPGGAEAKDAAVVSQLGKVADSTYDAFLNWLPTYVHAAHAASSTGAPDDNGGHGGHLGPQTWVPMTDQAECEQLETELETAKAIALKYPHPGDAEAAGWRRVTGYVPGIAAHYMNFSLVDGTFKVDEPEMLLYDGNDPGANIVGLSYYMIHDSDYEPTQGFTGPNDHFHRHVGLCVNGTGVVGDSATTAEECAARGGTKSVGTGGWMSHLWIVPGCESPWGLFSGASPTLEGSLGAASGTDGGGCAGSKVIDRFDLTPGTSSNVPPSVVGGPSNPSS